MTHKVYVYLFLSVLVAVGCVHSAYAQQGTGAERSMLPDIDPQDIEIRSEFKANFRGLTRQPILGFRPQERIYEVNPDRTPFIESQQERMAQLPVVELSRPDPPEMKLFSYPPAQNIYSEVGYGSYRSPRITFYGGMKTGASNRLLGHLDHHSSGGHLVGDFGAFRNFDADARYVASVGAGQLDLSVGGESNFNNLYPPSQQVSISDFRNEFDGARLDVAYKEYSNDYEGWEVNATYDLFEARSRVLNTAAETREQVGGIQAGYQWTGDRLHELYRLQLSAERGKFSGDPSYEGWYLAGADVTYERLLQHSLLFSGSLGVRGGKEPNGGELLLPTAELAAKYWIAKDLIIQADLGTKLSGETLKSRFDDNPFLLAQQPQYANSYRMGGELTVEYKPFERTLFSAGGSYHHVRDYSYMARGNRVLDLLSDDITAPGGSPTVMNYYKTFYENARIAELQFSLTHDLMPETFWIDVTGQVRNHKLTGDSDSPIPYLSDYRIKSSVYAKPIDTFRIRVWGEYVGPRETSDAAAQLESYLLVGSRFEMEVNERVGVFIEGKNVLDTQYQVWEGYTSRPLQLYGGVTLNL